MAVRASFLLRRAALASPVDAPVAAPVRAAGPSTALSSAVLTACAVGAALLTWAWSDVLIWQRIFETGRLWEFEVPYQAGHQAVLLGLIALGSIALLRSGWRWSIGYAVALYVLANGGVADLLYYWLDGRPVPATLPWLDSGHPLILVHPVTASSLLLSGAAWSFVWVAAFVAAVVASPAVRWARAIRHTTR